MEQLFQLLVFLVFFVIWVFNAVAQAKKQRQQELEEVFEEFEDDEFSPPERPARPTVAEPPPPARSGWEEIQRELRRMLEERPDAPQQAPPPRRPEPAPMPMPTPLRPQAAPLAPIRPKLAEPKRLPPSPPMSRTPTGRSITQVRTTLEQISSGSPSLKPVPSKPRPHLSKPKEKRETPLRRRFPYLHPDPLANAILLSEMLKPYSGPRPYSHRK